MPTLFMEENLIPKKKKGFAALPPDVRRYIASKGGKAAQATGRAHTFTAEEARLAGKKGGKGKGGKKS